MLDIHKLTKVQIIGASVTVLIVICLVSGFFYFKNKKNNTGEAIQEKQYPTNSEIKDTLTVPDREEPKLTEEEQETVNTLSVPSRQGSGESSNNAGPSVSDSEIQRQNDIVKGLSVPD